MKCIKLTGIFVAVSLFLLQNGLRAYIDEDRIIARVNNDIITLSELNERLQPIVAKYEQSYSGAELLENLAKAEEYWLSQLIENKLILQEAHRQGITVSKEEIEDRFAQIKDDFDNDLQFKIFLESQGMNIDQLKRNIEDNLKITKTTMHIRQKAQQKISPIDVVRYYEDHKDEFAEEPKVHVLHILIRSTGDDESDLAKATKVLDLIKSGEDFKAVAQEYSQGPHAARGGDLGFLSHGQHIPEIDKAAFSLQVGEVSDLIKSPLGYHIIKIKQKKKERVKPFVEVQDEIQSRLLKDKAKNIWDDWMNGLKTKSFIEIYNTR
ncbi:MAG: peptidylprolyl isomerase [Candidatus Auribacterota bacterium]|jgi:parvulin-like peptidyl-prolyl isomerase|nr:peptidylprolyl isomerase [Candidatus Auribacterota bacterium]